MYLYPGDLLDESLPDGVDREPLYWGGPVQPQALCCLVHHSSIGAGADGFVVPGLRLAHALGDLGTTDTGADAVRYRFFAGYAGWAAGQLDNEMDHEAWLTHPASLDLVFHPDPVDLWQTILRRKGPEYRLLAATPEDVTRN